MGSGSIATAKCGELRRGAAGELAEGRGHHCEQAAKHAQRGNFLATMSLHYSHTHTPCPGLAAVARVIVVCGQPAAFVRNGNASKALQVVVDKEHCSARLQAAAVQQQPTNQPFVVLVDA